MQPRLEPMPRAGLVAEFPTARAELDYLVELLIGRGSTSDELLAAIEAALRRARGELGVEAFDRPRLHLATDDFRGFDAGSDPSGRFRICLDDFGSFRELQAWQFAAGARAGLDAYDAPGFLPFDLDDAARRMLREAAAEMIGAP